jgi:protein ImuA
MPAEPDRLAALRRSMAARLASVPPSLAPLGCAAADARLGGGVERGGLHEAYAASEADAAAAAGFAVALALRCAGPAPVVWLRRDLAGSEQGELYGPGLHDLGGRPGEVLIVRAARLVDFLRAAGEALRCPAVGALVIEEHGPAPALDLVASRRLALAARESGVTAVLLRAGAEPGPSAARTRWRIAAAPSAAGPAFELGRPRFSAELLRSRNGAVGRFVMEWDSDARRFSTPAPAFRPRLPAAHDRPAGAVGDLRRAG